MAKEKRSYVCSACGVRGASWIGRCNACGAWNTIEEIASRRTVAPRPAVEPLADLDVEATAVTVTGIAELDRVLGGGLVEGSVTLLGGAPGIGKSTIVLQAAMGWANDAAALYVAAEESGPQVRRRADRLGDIPGGLSLMATCDLDEIVAEIANGPHGLVVVDSIQTVVDVSVGSLPGSPAQVRSCASKLVEVAKRSSSALVLVGHVTKDGELAGPRLLEHLVDTVLTFDGERHHDLRLLRAVKHRFGPTGELGLFEMGESGLTTVDDASGIFLSDRALDAPGSAVFPAMEGTRPLLVEVQSLVTPAHDNVIRRVHGLDSGRLSMVLAVLAQRCGLRLADRDVHAAVAGGVRVAEPGVDLAVALSVASALTERPLSSDTVVFGEVGLAGEVRQVGRVDRRLAEAGRLGFRQAIVPERCASAHGDLEVFGVSTVFEAMVVSGVVATGSLSGSGSRAAGDS